MKDGNEEVVKLVTHDGRSEKEVVSEKKLKEEAGGYTQLKASELKTAEKNENGAFLNEVPLVSDQEPRGNYGIVEGATELEVEKIASQENMGIPAKTTEYSAGDTYPARTWSYEYEGGGVKHFFKVFFNTEGKVVRVNHQAENK